MTSQSSSSPQLSDTEDHSSPPIQNPNSIDHSLDAIENQLSSLSFTTALDDRNNGDESVPENDGESSFVWRNDDDVEEGGGGGGGMLESPSSSGYAGEIGSDSSNDDDDGIKEVREDNGDDREEANAELIRGKQRSDEVIFMKLLVYRFICGRMQCVVILFLL